MNTIDIETLKYYLLYSPDTGEFIWKNKTAPQSNIKIGDIAGTKAEYGRIKIRIKKGQFLAHRLAWLYVYGEMPKELDHINSDQSDNRISNLRKCSHKENCMNRKTPSNNTSGEKGVSWSKKSNKWWSRCYSNGVLYQLGYYENIIDASLAYKTFAIKAHGSFYKGDISCV